MAAPSDRTDTEARLLRALAKVHTQARQRILDTLGDPPDPRNVPPAVWDGIEADLRGALLPELERIYVAAAEGAASELGIGFAWDVVNTDAATWARQYGYDLVRGVNDNSRRLLQESIGGFFETPLTNAQLQEKLSRVFGPRRAESIAITEVSRASVEGTRAAVGQIETQLREGGLEPVAYWITANDSLTCPICGPRNGKRQGDGWQDFPPAHPRCRCNVRYTFEAVDS